MINGLIWPFSVKHDSKIYYTILLEIVFALAKDADPYEMLLSASFYFGL